MNTESGLTTFFLIRHGEVDNPKKIVYGRTEMPLSNKGKIQIKNVALRLKKMRVIPDVIISSDLERTKQSTEEMLKVFPDTLVIYTSDLEEVDTAGLTGELLEYQHLIGDIYHAKECEGMGIERPESIIERQLRILKKALEKYPGKTIFIVGHKQPLEFLVWKLLNPSDLQIASIIDIEKKYLIKKGEVREVVLGKDLNVIKYQPINSDDHEFSRGVGG